LDNRFVYLVISPRTRGLSIGVNLTPEVRCSFLCLYCEVPRDASEAPRDALDVDVMGGELRRTLNLVLSGRLSQREGYGNLDPSLLTLREVLLSGDGEPTLAPRFSEAVLQVAQLRATGEYPFFKIALCTNGSHLDNPGVQGALKYLTARDDIWIKLDAGTQEYMSVVNGPNARLSNVLDNILLVGRARPVGIQSLFPKTNGKEPSGAEIQAYVERLKELKSQGAQIQEVQVFSAGASSRPSVGCEYLSLKSLQKICRSIQSVAGIKAEVY
jgi:wyosine [tRNA(Phe)-imidazoG37] synthetase (radical SAM superfamily)